MTDPVALTKALLACESVTPAQGPVFDVLEAALLPLGFTVDRFVVGASNRVGSEVARAARSRW